MSPDHPPTNRVLILVLVVAVELRGCLEGLPASAAVVVVVAVSIHGWGLGALLAAAAVVVAVSIHGWGLGALLEAAVAVDLAAADLERDVGLS